MNKLVDKVPDGYALISIDALKAWGKYDEVRNACQFSAEQAEQEPVAWILMKADGTMDFDCQPNIKPTQNDYDVLREGETFTPLYAAPVRTKDLTDDDLLGIWFGTDGLIEGLRAVIAADREKNRG